MFGVERQKGRFITVNLVISGMYLMQLKTTIE